ncbi:MAG TPA: hypothetical protein VGI39_08885 [Polyangiaceae bacterium]|jgi:hypothetical protein
MGEIKFEREEETRERLAEDEGAGEEAKANAPKDLPAADLYPGVMTFLRKTNELEAEMAAGYAKTQPERDAARRELAGEIVESQSLKTIDEAKAFAKAWIATAAQYASNEEYWHARAMKAEGRILVPANDPRGSVLDRIGEPGELLKAMEEWVLPAVARIDDEDLRTRTLLILGYAVAKLAVDGRDPRVAVGEGAPT